MARPEFHEESHCLRFGKYHQLPENSAQGKHIFNQKCIYNPFSSQNTEKYWLFTLKITWLTGSYGSLQPPNITTELHAKYLNLAKNQDSKYSSTKCSFLHHVKSKKCKSTHHESRTTWLGEVGNRTAKHVCVSGPAFTHSTTHTKIAGPLPSMDTAILCW